MVVVNPLPCFDWPLGLVVSRVARLLDRLRMRLYACLSDRKEGEGQLCRKRDGAAGWRTVMLGVAPDLKVLR